MERNPNERKIVTLTLTEACNIRCTYCYEENKSKKFMTFETAKAILDYEFAVDDGYCEIEVDFFGGEPFLKFELMKQIFDYVGTIQSCKKRICFATTNGTLVHGEIQEWLRKNKDKFWLGLSLDGTKEMHDLNRTNSFDMIDLNFFKECWPKQDIKMTVSRESLPMLAEGIKFVEESGFVCSGSFAYGIEWNLEQDLPILERELKKISDYYIANPERKIAPIIFKDIKHLNYEVDKNLKWCGAGKQMRTHDVDGNSFPCQFFMGLSIGELSNIQEKYFEQNISLFDPKCEGCDLYSICPTCYGINYSTTGQVNIRDEYHCEFNKLLILANAYIEYHRLKLKIDAKMELTEEEKMTITAIDKIYTIFK